MGCGKSSVGKELSRLLCCPFIDLDDVIEERAGRTIPEIFATDGEKVFRQMELETLQDLAVGGKMPLPFNRRHGQETACNDEDTLILALGGGAVMTEACAEIVREKTLCIYLKASLDTLVEHLSGGEAAGRPMLSGGSHSERPKGNEESALRTRIENLMALRSETYEKTAHIIIDTDGKSIEETANLILTTT